jgi:hypothetical protein
LDDGGSDVMDGVADDAPATAAAGPLSEEACFDIDI